MRKSLERRQRERQGGEKGSSTETTWQEVSKDQTIGVQLRMGSANQSQVCPNQTALPVKLGPFQVD